MKITKNESGFSLVEILLAISVFAIFAVGITYLSLDTLDRDAKVVLNNEALHYAQEGLEVVRNIRDRNFLLLTNGDHGLALADNVWTFGLAPEAVDSFYERRVTISDVYRDIDGNIAEEGTLDPDTKRIDSTISWTQNGVIPRSITLTEYLANWRADDWIVTTCPEFNGGTFTNTEVIDLNPPPDVNCGIKLVEMESGSEFFSSANVGKHGTDVDVDGNYAYMTVNDMNSGFQIVNVSNPQSPSIVSSLNIGKKGTSAKKDGNYAYIGLDQSAGLKIINVSAPGSPSVTSTINLGAAANQSDVKDDYLYTAINQTSNSFKSYNVTNKAAPSLTKTINFGDNLHTIKIHGDYAYVGSFDDETGLRVLDISNPSNVHQVGSLSVGEEVHAIAISGNIAFLGVAEDDESLKVVDITTPASPSLITEMDVNGMIQDLTISGDYLYAAVDSVHGGLAGVNISDPYNPYLIYNLDAGGKGTGIDSDENYIYITTNTANKGLVIIGTTVTGMTTNGTYVSEALDTGSSDTVYNFIEWVSQEVQGGSIRFQIRTANSVGNLDTATWVGPDGTGSTYYETSRTSITLDPGRTGDRYFQYNVILDSTGVSSPVLDSVRINYTP